METTLTPVKKENRPASPHVARENSNQGSELYQMELRTRNLQILGNLIYATHLEKKNKEHA